jgi:hypothetical protein
MHGHGWTVRNIAIWRRSDRKYLFAEIAAAAAGYYGFQQIFGRYALDLSFGNVISTET